MNIALPIYFPTPITGRQIIEALDQTIHSVESTSRPSLVKDIEWEGDAEAFTIGQASLSPSEELIVRVGEHFSKETVRPEGRYVSLVIANYSWPGVGWAVNTTDKRIMEYLKSFRERLMQQFSENLKIPLEQIVKKTEECQGSGISDIRYVCPYCDTGLKENPGNCPKCGGPLGTLMPIY